MSSNRALNAFLTSAAALGGLYLLDKFMSRGDGSRENPQKTYKHIKAYEEFTEAEKQQIANEYEQGLKSVKMLYKEHSTTDQLIERILREEGVTLRDNAEATRLRHTIQVTQEQIDTILRMWNPPIGESRATIAEICDATNLKRGPIKRILKEHAGYKKKEREELSEDDKKKLLQGKIKERNGTGETLLLTGVHKQLGLSRLPGAATILRLFAENNLNNPSDYVGSLNYDQRVEILSHFNPEQTLTLEQIAEKVGTTVSKVKVFLFYNNIIPREPSTFKKKPLTEEERAEVIRLYDEGNTNEQIAARTSISLSRVRVFIKEYRESQGLTESRLSESMRKLRPSLMTRNPLVIKKIMEARSQNPPLSFQKIADKLNKEMPKEKGFERFSISWGTVQNIYQEQMRNAQVV